MKDDIQETKEDLSAFFDEVFDRQYREAFEKEKDKSRKGNLQFVMREKGQILAAMSCKRLYQALKISDLAVTYSQQQAGIGSRMLDFIKDYAQKEGILSIILTTRSYQAKDFYLKNGFQVFGQLENVPFKGVATYYLVYYLPIAG